MPEDRFCRELAAEAAELGLAVIVFGPDGVNGREGRVTGYALDNGAWARAEDDMPSVVYDRRFAGGMKARIAAGRALSALRTQGVIALGGSLPGKLEVYRALQRSPAIRRLLPPTCRFRGGGQLESLIAAHPGGLFLKPSSGMQGRGTLAISPQTSPDEWIVTGRSMRNGPYRRRLRGLSAIEAAAARLAEGRVYLVQPLLELNLPGGAPFDIRALVQKDGSGRWTYTGAAARIGKPGTATANLHGGGSACRIAPFLAAHYAEEDAERLLRDIRSASLLVAEMLESSFGRFAELGIDFGIEPSGRLWLIEANARPGRAVFAVSRDERARRQSVRRPLQYARYLMKDMAVSKGKQA